ncbi:TrbI/VirB10 family protein [Gammaproteobacteria bacterium]|nr:TrbI/VirB10 family protein [Gammaproteobacteria bacterium]
MSLRSNPDPTIPNTVSKNRFVNDRVIFVAAGILLVFLAVIVIYGWMNRKSNVGIKNTDASEVAAMTSTMSEEEFERQVGRKAAELEALRRKQEKQPAVPTTPENSREQAAQIIRELNRSSPTVRPDAEPDPFALAQRQFLVDELVRAQRSVSSPIGFGASSRGDTTESLSDSETVNRSSPEQVGSVPSSVVPDYTQSAQPAAAVANGPTFAPVSASGSTTDTSSEVNKTLAGVNATQTPSPPPGHLTLPAGTSVPVVLQSRVNSDIPGGFIARVSRDIYDTSKEYILVPAGTRALGNAFSISPTNAAINARMGLTISAFRLNNGLYIDLQDEQVLDSAGIGGVEDNVDYHILTQVLATIGYAVTLGGTAAWLDDQLGGSGSNNDTTTDESGVVVVTTGDGQAQITRQFAEDFSGLIGPLFSRYIGLVPTIELDPGTQMNVILSRDTYVRPTESIYKRYTQ